MINLNEIAFIDEDGFEFNSGESLIRFDVVAYCPDTKKITFAMVGFVATFAINPCKNGSSKVRIEMYCSEFSTIIRQKHLRNGFKKKKQQKKERRKKHAARNNTKRKKLSNKKGTKLKKCRLRFYGAIRKAV